MNTTEGSVVIIIIGAASNVGAAALIIKWLLGKVDKHNELLPKISAQLETTTTTQQVISESISELFDSRNELKERVVRIETTIKHNGCDSCGEKPK